MIKKFLVPIMALAIAVTAGVNYKMISNSVNATGLSLTSLIKMTLANAEDLDEVTVTTTGNSEVRDCSSTDGTWTYCDCSDDSPCTSSSC